MNWVYHHTSTLFIFRNLRLLIRPAVVVSLALLATACSEGVPDCTGVTENVKALSLTQFDRVVERFVTQNSLNGQELFGKLKILSKSSNLSAIRLISENPQTGAKLCRAVATFTADIAFVPTEYGPNVDKFDSVAKGMGELIFIPFLKAMSEQTKIPNQIDISYTIVKMEKGGFYTELVPEKIYGDGIKFRVVAPVTATTTKDTVNKSDLAATTGAATVAEAVSSPAQTAEGKANPVLVPPVATSVVTDPVSELKPFAPSFDCTKATTGAERLICSSRELSQADIKLSIAYREALAKSADAAALRKSQQEWRKLRDACSDASCMLSAYTSRAASLN